MEDRQPAALHSKSLHQGGRPRTNFPLPPELRDQIYGYLLDGKHTRVKRKNLSDPAYKFHTNILRVNHEIHDEAQEYLYKRNVFIVVSYQYSDKKRAAIAAWVPVINELHQSNTLHRSLEIHLSEDSFASYPASEIPKRTWLLLLNDLGSYCLSMTQRLGSRMKKSRHLLLGRDGRVFDGFLDEKGQQRHCDHLRLELCSQLYHRPSHELQSSLLLPFLKVGGPNVVACVRGDVLDRDAAETLKVSMSPSLHCVNVLNWRFILALFHFKDTADVSARRGETAIAVHLYDKVMRALEPFRRGLASQPPYLKSAICKLSMYTLLTKAYLQVISVSEDTTGFCDTVSLALKTFQIPLLPGCTAGSYLLHLHMLAVVATSTFSPPLPSVTISECITRLTHSNSNPLARHDAAVLKKCADHNKLFTPDDLPIKSSSFYAAPKKPTGYSGRAREPDHIVGWLDIEQLRNTDKATREKINRLQAERGWPITPFESYD